MLGRSLLGARSAAGCGPVYCMPVRHLGAGKKKAVPITKKVSPKEQKRREMLMLMGRSAMFDLENKPKKEDIPYSYTQIKAEMKPVVIPDDVEDERAWAVQAYARGRHAVHLCQCREMYRMVKCRRHAMEELFGLSLYLYKASTMIRMKDLPLHISSLPDTPPIPGYQPPPISITGGAGRR
eukprot:scpid102339/ scgid16688/ 